MRRGQRRTFHVDWILPDPLCRSPRGGHRHPQLHYPAVFRGIQWFGQSSIKTYSSGSHFRSVR